MSSDAEYDARFHAWCNNCAVQWGALPLVVSAPIAPILFLFFPAIYVILACLFASILWTILGAYRYGNLLIASRISNGVYYTRWVIAFISSIVLIDKGQYLTAFLAMIWPLIAIGIIVYWPADIEYIEDAFYKQRDIVKLKI